MEMRPLSLGIGTRQFGGQRAKVREGGGGGGVIDLERDMERER
jgi:hypothetical protein